MSSKAGANEFAAELRQLLDVAQALEGAIGSLEGALQSIAPEPFETGVSAARGITEGLVLTSSQRLICERVINVFETGTIEGKYGAISIFHDGPHRIRQITYGRSQTTEYGNLRELVQMYVAAAGQFSEDLRRFAPKVGRVALTDDLTFRALLKRAGSEDPVMRQTQDAFFERRYFAPAMEWAGARGFTRALSALVIYDSFIHSGSIRPELRSRFTERPPAQGGNEQTWIRQYVDVRHAWLTNHSNPEVRPSNYRTRDLAREIVRGNWDLDLLPIMANRVAVNDRALAMRASAAGGDDLGLDDIEYLGPPDEGVDIDEAEADEAWCESEQDFDAAPRVAAVVESSDILASRILANPGITLATGHPSGKVDNANAQRNIQNTAAGRAAERSSYQNAPGGTVELDPRMLSALVELSKQFTFAVTEIAGGSHSPQSRHYAGIAFDIGVIDGRRISASHPSAGRFQARCRDLGATEVLGPGKPGHSTHVHAAWPRLT